MWRAKGETRFLSLLHKFFTLAAGVLERDEVAKAQVLIVLCTFAFCCSHSCADY